MYDLIPGMADTVEINYISCSKVEEKLFNVVHYMFLGNMEVWFWLVVYFEIKPSGTE